MSRTKTALIAKTDWAKRHGAPRVEIWGTGTPLREFLHVADLAAALVFLMTRYSGEWHINVGTGEEISIAELARLIGEIVGFGGTYHYRMDKPDGAPRKLLDVSRLAALGWRSSIALRAGLVDAYRGFVEREARTVLSS